MKVKEWIAEKKMTQADLAEWLEVDRSWINQVLNGKRKPSAKIARRIESITNGRIKAVQVMSGAALDGPCKWVTDPETWKPKNKVSLL